MTTETRQRAQLQDTTRVTRAWQDSIEAITTGYRQQWQQAAGLTSDFWSMRWLDRDEVRDTVTRITRGTREVTSAQAAITAGWLRAPLWITGNGSPVELQDRYFRLFEAQRDLARAYVDAALGVQRALLQAGERTAESAREVIDSQTQTARRVANDTRDAQQAAVESTRRTTTELRDTVRETSQAVTNNVRNIAEAGREATREAADNIRTAADSVRETTERVTEPSHNGQGRTVKAHTNSRNERIYYIPGQANYDRLEAEETFASEEEAQAAGYRRSMARGGGTIKGNINAKGEKIYHLPGQANYDRIDAEALFENEEQAQAAGFRPAQR